MAGGPRLHFALVRAARTFCALVAVLLAAACGAGGGQADPADVDPLDVPDTVAAGPAGAEFYDPGQPPDGAAPGDLVWARRIIAPRGVDGYLVLYWSTDVDDALVPVSAVVYRGSDAPASAPILAWAHGTHGLGRECAASIDRYTTRPVDLTFESRVVDLGMVFVATDYAGLGTPGVHPYMVNRSAARNVLDSARAAARLAGVGSRPRTILAGESQGGAATLVAAEIFPSYAPDLAVRAVVALAPPSRLRELDEALDGGAYFGYVLMTVHGYQGTYPELEALSEHLTPRGEQALERIATWCTDDILRRLAGGRGAEYGVDAIVNSPEFEARLEENEPGHHRPGAPVMIVHGEEDETIPVRHTHELVERYCEASASVAASFVDGAGHLVLREALDEVHEYVRDRLSGQPLPVECGAGFDHDHDHDD